MRRGIGPPWAGLRCASRSGRKGNRRGAEGILGVALLNGLRGAAEVGEEDSEVGQVGVAITITITDARVGWHTAEVG